MRSAHAVGMIGAWLILLVPRALPAQHPERFDGAQLQPGTDTLHIYWISGADTVQTGLVVDRLQVVQAGGEEHLVRLYLSSDERLGFRRDSITDLRATLAPLRLHSVTENGTEVAEFSGGQVDGYAITAAGDSVRVTMPLRAGAINASSFDLALRGAPLALGWEIAYESVAVGSQAVIPTTARVTALEPVAGEPCWRLDAIFGGVSVRFWISQETRRLRQQVMVLRPDLSVLFRAVPVKQTAPGTRAT